MPKWLKWAGAIFAGLVVLGAIFGDDSSKKDATTAKAPLATAAPAADKEVEPQPVAFKVTSHQDAQTVRKPTVTLRGTVDPDATLKVDGHRVKIAASGHWAKRVALRLGENDLTLEATKLGAVDNTVTLALTRKRSAAELAAYREAQRIKREQAAARRAAARAAREAAFKASATTVPYNQLEKSPDRYSGTKVKYYGQIFQIQENPGGGGIMLVSVTDLGYGMWDDNVWVNYDGTVQGAEGDMVTVYGVVRGSKSYETQIGGETYVPEVDAKYVTG